MAKLCKALSFAVILLVLIVYLPITIPGFLHYDVYSVVSGSMEPTINVGSIIYTKAIDPEDLNVGDIVIFQPPTSGMPISHRVTHNDPVSRQLITKGDANEDEDLRPIEYQEVKGKVEFHIPYYGYFADAASTLEGKLAAVIFLLCGILLSILSNQISISSDGKKERRKSSALSAVVLLFFTLLVSFGALAGYKTIESFEQRSKAENENEKYLEQESAYSMIAFEPETDEGEPEKPLNAFELRPRTEAPDIQIEIPELDFEKIREESSENLCGWIYIPDTLINYPVYHTTDNDFYLHHSGTGRYSDSGAIFLDALNSPDYDDTHCILYGHHMRSGKMFAGLSKYKNEGFYEEHRFGVLITEEEVHLIEFFSGYVANVEQDAWDLNFDGEEGYAAWLDTQCELSCFESDLHPKTGDRVITLSTCSYEFSNARFIIHGILY